MKKTSQHIHDKLATGERLSVADGVELFEKFDLHELGQLASEVRQKLNGKQASYLANRYINYSNLCILSCQFCAFSAKKGDAHAFELSVDEIVSLVKKALDDGITEVHMVGGLHPKLGAEIGRAHV